MHQENERKNKGAGAEQKLVRLPLSPPCLDEYVSGTKHRVPADGQAKLGEVLESAQGWANRFAAGPLSTERYGNVAAALYLSTTDVCLLVFMSLLDFKIDRTTNLRAIDSLWQLG